MTCCFVYIGVGGHLDRGKGVPDPDIVERAVGDPAAVGGREPDPDATCEPVDEDVCNRDALDPRAVSLKT